MRALADLTQLLGQRGDRRVIELRGIVQQQDDRGTRSGDDRPGPLGVAADHRLMRHLRSIHEPIESPQIGGPIELVGQRAAGMPAHDVGDADQAVGPSLVAQIELAEVEHAKGPWRGIHTHLLIRFADPTSARRCQVCAARQGVAARIRAPQTGQTI